MKLGCIGGPLGKLRFQYPDPVASCAAASSGPIQPFGIKLCSNHKWFNGMNFTWGITASIKRDWAASTCHSAPTVRHTTASEAVPSWQVGNPPPGPGCATGPRLGVCGQLCCQCPRALREAGASGISPPAVAECRARRSVAGPARAACRDPPRRRTRTRLPGCWLPNRPTAVRPGHAHRVHSLLGHVGRAHQEDVLTHAQLGPHRLPVGSAASAARYCRRRRIPSGRGAAIGAEKGPGRPAGRAAAGTGRSRSTAGARAGTAAMAELRELNQAPTTYHTTSRCSDSYGGFAHGHSSRRIISVNYYSLGLMVDPCHLGVTTTQYLGKVSVVSTLSAVLWTTAVLGGKQTV